MKQQMTNDLFKVAEDSVRSSFFLISGTALSTVILAIGSILTGRFLGPELYGQYTLALVVSTLLLTFTDLGINQGITKFTASLKAKGETWYFTVIPKDGTDFGTLQTSTNVTIQNSPPSISSVTITPDPAYANDTLTANPTSPYDADGDTVTFTYQWQKYEEGNWVNIAGATNQTLEPENFVQGDQIKIICTPYDGQDYGPPQEAIITISNTPP